MSDIPVIRPTVLPVGGPRGRTVSAKAFFQMQLVLCPFTQETRRVAGASFRGKNVRISRVWDKSAVVTNLEHHRLNSDLQVYPCERTCPISAIGPLRVLRSQSAVRRTVQAWKEDPAA